MNHFLDIGANQGQTFTDFLCKDSRYDGWTVWCFEPSPRHLPELMKTAEQFRHRYQIRICPFGVWSEDGLCVLHQKDDPRGDSFFWELSTDHEVNNLDTGYQVMVPVRDITWILSQVFGGELVVKLDCEGSEYPILERLLHWPEIQFITELYVEFHNIGESHPSAQELIDAYASVLPIKPWTL